MNAPLSGSLLAAVELAPRDPILGVTEAFVADTNPRKVNLGVGVYNDDNGKLPVLECVKRAEHAMAGRNAPYFYLPIDGIPAYDREVRKLLFGADSDIVTSGRAVTVQALGGTGGLKIGADFLRRFAPGGQVWAASSNGANLYSTGGPDNTMSPSSLNPSGGGQPHDNRQPYLGLNFIIALVGIFPSRN